MGNESRFGRLVHISSIGNSWEKQIASIGLKRAWRKEDIVVCEYSERERSASKVTLLLESAEEMENVRRH